MKKRIDITIEKEILESLDMVSKAMKITRSEFIEVATYKEIKRIIENIEEQEKKGA